MMIRDLRVELQAPLLHTALTAFYSVKIKNELETFEKERTRLRNSGLLAALDSRFYTPEVTEEEEEEEEEDKVDMSAFQVTPLIIRS